MCVCSLKHILSTHICWSEREWNKPFTNCVWKSHKVGEHTQIQGWDDDDVNNKILKTFFCLFSPKHKALNVSSLWILRKISKNNSDLRVNVVLSSASFFCSSSFSSFRPHRIVNPFSSNAFPALFCGASPLLPVSSGYLTCTSWIDPFQKSCAGLKMWTVTFYKNSPCEKK